MSKLFSQSGQFIGLKLTFKNIFNERANLGFKTFNHGLNVNVNVNWLSNNQTQFIEVYQKVMYYIILLMGRPFCTGVESAFKTFYTLNINICILLISFQMFLM